MNDDEAASPAAENFNWLLGAFVEETPGVLYTIAVSADGLLVANSGGLERSSAEQLGAIVSGLVSLAQGADRCLQGDGIEQMILEFGNGFLFVTSLGDSAALAVLADKDGEIGLIAYEMTLLVARAGSVLTPDLIAELKTMAAV
jgi:predicted regulator of Ras-like GTPase activity (Roadblock/LC7/MglB family)